MSTTKVQRTKAASTQAVLVSPDKVRYTLETVTPALAEGWLTKNTANRRIRRHVVDRYSRDMEAGEWQENGEGICFASDGTLLNGQHRLSAIVATGMSILMLVVRDLPMASQDAMDDGAKRSAADTFGFHSINNATTAAAATRRILMWQAGARTNTGGVAPSKAEMLDAWRTDPVLRSAVEATVDMRKRSIVPHSIIALTYWLFSQVDADACAMFWHSLHYGENLGRGNPIHVVRERIIHANATPGRVRETEYLVWVIKAWNLWRDGKKITDRYRSWDLKAGEKFPEAR